MSAAAAHTNQVTTPYVKVVKAENNFRRKIWMVEPKAKPKSRAGRSQLRSGT